LFRTGSEELLYSHVLELDLGRVESSVAGPKRPQDRVAVRRLHTSFEADLRKSPEQRGFGVSENDLGRTADVAGKGELQHGSVIIASITSCTNTSNPT
jgi:aconitate hydratase